MPSIFIPPQPADPRRLGFSPRRNIGAVQQRRRVVALKAVQGISAASVPAAATAYPYLAPPVNLSGFDSFLLTLTATSAVSGTPVGVQLVVQCYDVTNQPVAAPNSPYTLTLFPGVTTGVLARAHPGAELRRPGGGGHPGGHSLDGRPVAARHQGERMSLCR